VGRKRAVQIVHAGNILNIAIGRKKAEHLLRLFRHIAVHHTENIKFGPSGLQAPKRIQDTGAGPVSGRVHPKSVMYGRGAVKGNADQEAFPDKKINHLIGKGVSVGLDCVADTQPLGIVHLFITDQLPVKIQSGQRGFPALKGKGQLPVRIAHGAPHQIFQGTSAHSPHGRARPSGRHIDVETIAAAHIAV